MAWCAPMQVVNALLTQLDKLKHRKNCLIMTTSNLSEAIGQSKWRICSARDADLGFFFLSLA